MRIAFVTPRYGRDVVGGAERLARDYATRLAASNTVTVLTTCARDYITWRDHFAPGESVEDGVRVLRFSVPEPRDTVVFDAINARVMGARVDAPDEERWMDAQGPNAPGLVAHLRDSGHEYDVVIFVPYLYATTVRGLPLVAKRSVLIPALHDEPPLRLAIFQRVIEGAQALVFSTPEEQALAVRRFQLPDDAGAIVGVGVDPVVPSPETSAVGDDRPYVVCVGRIDPSKGSDRLIDFHRAYRARVTGGVDLVMIGPSAMPVPREPWLRAEGVVSEARKHEVIAGAAALVCPSPYESLSLVLLEAWSHGVPTLSFSASDVLVGQSRRSGAGLWYESEGEYGEAVALLARNPAVGRSLGYAGRRYVQALDWPSVIGRLRLVLTRVAEAAAR